MRSRAVLVGLWLAVASACSNDGGSGDMPISLRSGAVKIHEGERHDWTGLDPRAVQKTYVSIHDVSRTGNRVVVTITNSAGSIGTYHTDPSCTDCSSTVSSAGGSLETFFLVSEDLGKTWTRHDLPNAAGLGQYILGIHVSGAKATLVTKHVEKLPQGDLVNYPLRDVDLAGNTYLPNPALEEPLHVQPHAAGDDIAGLWLFGSPYSQTINQHWQRYSLSRGTLSQIHDAGDLGLLPPRVPYGLERNLLMGVDGKALGGVFFRVEVGAAHLVEPRPAALCWLAGDQFQAAGMRVECKDPSTLNAVLYRGGTEAPTGAGILPVVNGPDGNAYALLPDGSGVKSLGLGEGGYFPPGDRLHPQFGDLIRLTSGGNERLVALGADGSRQLVRLPPKPCAEGDPCGNGAWHVWALPLGNDEWLDFYSVEAFRGEGTHPSFYATRDVATREGFVAPDRPKVSGDPWLLAGKLEQACMSATLCGIPGGFVGCVGYWRARPYGSPALARFLSTPLNDCARFRANWPDQALLQSSPCQIGCRGDVLVSRCDGGLVSVATDCSAYGAQCRDQGGVLACAPAGEDLAATGCTAKGNAVLRAEGFVLIAACPAGMTCVPAAGTEGGASCGYAATLVPGCEGDVATHPAKDGQPAFKEDCSLRARTCVMKQGVPECFRDPVDWSNDCSGASLGLAPKCLGTTLTYCSESMERHVLDCVEMGGTGCQGAAEAATCH